MNLLFVSTGAKLRLLDSKHSWASRQTKAPFRCEFYLNLHQMDKHIASYYQPNCAEKRDAIKDTGAYPAFTLALTIKDTNALLAHGWPNAKKIGTIPDDRVAVILICEERCLSVLMRRE